MHANDVTELLAYTAQDKTADAVLLVLLGACGVLFLVGSKV